MHLKTYLFIAIYRLLFPPILLCVLPYYLLRMRKRGGYGKHFFNRFGWLPKPQLPSPVWIQAVSVGEIESLRPLLVTLKQRNIPVYLTTTTSTAFRIVEKKYASLVDTFGYFPLDFWLFSALARRRIGPRAILLTESELWPEHLFQAKNTLFPFISLTDGFRTERFRIINDFCQSHACCSVFLQRSLPQVMPMRSASGRYVRRIFRLSKQEI
ncbi:MAG: hypothetical protein IJ793_04450 [Opitutales bacterium]|nr:hypothetical protein [Opitutales bacterium]